MRPLPRRVNKGTGLFILFAGGILAMGSCAVPATEEIPTPEKRPDRATDVAGTPPRTTGMYGLIPIPVSTTSSGEAFTLTSDAVISVRPGTMEMFRLGEYLADRLRPSTGYELPVVPADGALAPGGLHLMLVDGPPEFGGEGYELTIRPDTVLLKAQEPAGLFHGVQTLRQLLPPSIESAEVQPGPWAMAAGILRDHPRFEWRGAMLDVARHFFGVEDVKRFIDLLAYYKLNRLHLHLTDDQGWRIMIESWPNLARTGGSTAVAGDAGGYYTQAEYSEIVDCAAEHYITVVPEIDMPGHTQAALASYGELNCDGVAPPLYTGIDVGFSSLCLSREATYKFIEDVVREIAAMTPGSYFHLGGDEAAATEEAEYKAFVERVQTLVGSRGKTMIGWEEIAQAQLQPGTIVQHWHSDLAARAVQQGAKVIMSPADKAYLDMQYQPSSPLGLHWAGYVEVRDSYEWDPATRIEGVSETEILGVEAPLWSETLRTIEDVEFMAFPRLAGIAEVGWSPAEGRGWDEYRSRLGAHGSRWAYMNVDYYRSPQVPWK